jgi:fatty-acyl-CoA synthase
MAASLPLPPPHSPGDADPLRFWARVAPERAALVVPGTASLATRRWSYAELDAEAGRWAAELRARGVVAGDRVAVLAGNRTEVIHLFFAAGRIGAALVPLNWRLAAPELAAIVADAAPALLLAESRFSALAGAAAVSLEEVAAAAARRERPAGHRAADAEEPWLVLYTSGSTGTPKGAVLPHRQILFNAIATSTAWELGPGDVAPISTPLFHTGGWNVFATPLWFRGGTVVLLDGFEPESFLAALTEHGCTRALVVPTQLLMLTECVAWGTPLPRLRHFISGGAPCPATLAERVRRAGYGFREGYGLTECGPNCFATSDRLAAEAPGSVGFPVPFLEMKLVDEEGAEVAPGMAGELLLRGPQLFSGYLGRPDLTAAAITGDGWLSTGDLAVRDPAGLYRICGRRKEMFISGGENVYPGEVEAALLEMPQVLEAVVVGVPDPRWGEVGIAYVVARAGCTLSGRDVLEHARERLAGYKRPRTVCVVAEIPRLGSGKPDRRALASSPLPPTP